MSIRSDDKKAAKELNGRQFAQHCRDYGIPYYKEV
jgi:hypothetical protein